jgi:ATP-dependent helicase/nuclease subunit A
LQIAPLNAGVPHGYTLEENAEELIDMAWVKFTQTLNQTEMQPLREALVLLYELIGEHNTKLTIKAFINKRAEWWAANLQDNPLQLLQNLCGEDGQRDARLLLWKDQSLLSQIATLAKLLGQGTTANKNMATTIERALSEANGLTSFELIWGALIKAVGGKLEGVNACNLGDLILTCYSNLSRISNQTPWEFSIPKGIVYPF